MNCPKKESPWTDDRVELLKQLWATPADARAIAAEINKTGSNFSLNAVRGKAHRLYLPVKKDVVSRTARPGRAAA